MRSIDDTYNALGMNDHPEGSKKLDVEAIEDPELIRTVGDRLANLAAITGREKGKNPAVSDVEDDDEPTPDVEDDKDDDDDDEDVDDVKAVEPSKDKDSTPDKEEGIPDAYVRAAVHSGWKEEDIDELVKVNPAMALKTFQNLYISTNKASREWAALGRAKQDVVVKPEVKKDENKLDYADLDIAALKKEFEIDPAFEKVLEKVNSRDRQLVDTLNNLTIGKVVQDNSRVERAVKSADVAAEAAAEQQINGFFLSDPMKAYEKFYGKLNFGETWEDLPAGQKRNRYAVFTTADQMLAGASMQGYQMDLVEALEKAHLLVTDGMREEVIRSKIKKTSTKRKNSMLMRPSDGKSKGSDGGRPKTKNDLETKVAQRLAKTFGNR